MQQIADWLEKLGISEYAQRFAENGIASQPRGLSIAAAVERRYDSRHNFGGAVARAAAIRRPIREALS
jgi:SAM domain (Sterile alpha motif)